MADTPTLAPFSVPALIATSLDALLSAATLHLGDTLADGRKLEAPDPQEAWRALAAAQGLLTHVGPMLAEETVLPFRTAHAYLVKRLAETHPEQSFPVTAAMMLPLAPPAPNPGPAGLPNLQAIAQAGLAELGSAAPPAPPLAAAATGPLKRPGTGLPSRGSNPLFPPR